MAGISGSSLDVNGIVTQLMLSEQRPLQRLEQRESSYQARLSAYGNLSSAVSTFQTAMSSLTNPASILSLKATVSDSSVLSASAGTTAVPGSYAIEVDKLAQSQKLAAAGQASLNAVIGSGTISVDFGNISGGTFSSVTGTYSGADFTTAGGSATSITIDASNNTLSGIRDAINAAGASVTASIINDGGASPYRLVLSSDDTGAAASMRIAVTGDAALGTLLAHNPAGAQNLAEKVTAQDASFTVDGLTVTSPGNTMSDVIAGVTLTLAKTNTGSPASLTITRDQTSAQNQVKNFAEAYNTLQKTLRGLSSFDPATRAAGPLYADGTTSALGASIRATLTAQLAGAGRYTNLSQLGLSFQRDGTLKLDSAKLQAALSTAPAEAAAVFSQAGRSTDSQITYTGASSATGAGDYAVNISQLASRGSSSGSAAANLTITAGVNDALAVTLDGLSTTVTLTSGTYASATALADEVQARINAAGPFSTAGAAVTVSTAAGVLSLTSQRYGSASEIRITGGNGATDLLGATPIMVNGVNVAGSIGGVAATGNGQSLTGFAGSPADGLQLLVTGGPMGARGTLSYSRGFAYQLSLLAGRHLESSGTIANRTDGISASIKELGRQREALNTRLTLIEQRYRKQYSTLDGVLSSMQATQSYLSQQMDMLASLTSSSNS